MVTNNAPDLHSSHTNVPAHLHHSYHMSSQPCGGSALSCHHLHSGTWADGTAAIWNIVSDHDREEYEASSSWLSKLPPVSDIHHSCLLLIKQVSHKNKLNLKEALGVGEQYTANLPHTPSHSLSCATHTEATAAQLQPDVDFPTSLQPRENANKRPHSAETHPGTWCVGRTRRGLLSWQVAQLRKLLCPHIPETTPSSKTLGSPTWGILFHSLRQH